MSRSSVRPPAFTIRLSHRLSRREKKHKSRPVRGYQVQSERSQSGGRAEQRSVELSKLDGHLSQRQCEQRHREGYQSNKFYYEIHFIEIDLARLRGWNVWGTPVSIWALIEPTSASATLRRSRTTVSSTATAMNLAIEKESASIWTGAICR